MSTAPMRRTVSTDRSTTAMLLLLALAVVAIHCLFNGNYGFHRDELATIDDARDLAWGYVAYPPLTPAFGRLSLELFGTSLVGLRLFPALAFGLSMLLTSLMAREFGASRQTQLFSAVVMAFAPIALMGSSLYQYVSFDYLAWVALSWCVVRLLNSGDARWWLAIGAAIGLGLMTKYTVLVWVAALGVGTLLTPARRYLAHRSLWFGVAICALLFLPNLLWQWQHDFISLDFLQHIHERDVRIGRARVGLVPGDEDRRRPRGVLGARQKLRDERCEPAVTDARLCGHVVAGPLAGVHVVAEVGRDEREPRREVKTRAEWHVLARAGPADVRVIGGRVVADDVEIAGV